MLSSFFKVSRPVSFISHAARGEWRKMTRAKRVQIIVGIVLIAMVQPTAEYMHMILII